MKYQITKFPYFKGKCKVCGEKITLMNKSDKCSICDFSYKKAFEVKCKELEEINKSLTYAKRNWKKYKGYYLEHKRQRNNENWNFHAYSSER